MCSLVYLFWTLEIGQPVGPQWNWNLILFNTALFMIFPLQHSILPRPFVKQRIDTALHRPIYVLTSGIALWLVLYFWKPFGPVLYKDVAIWFFNIVFYACLILIIVSTVALNHSQMFGLHQGYAAWKRLPLPESKLRTDGIYGIVRHPITSLFILALWSHETMTTGRFLFNILFTAYALVGTVFEERSLLKELGKDYLDYKRKVPAFIPKLW